MRIWATSMLVVGLAAMPTAVFAQYPNGNYAPPAYWTPPSAAPYGYGAPPQSYYPPPAYAPPRPYAPPPMYYPQPAPTNANAWPAQANGWQFANYEPIPVAPTQPSYAPQGVVRTAVPPHLSGGPPLGMSQASLNIPAVPPITSAPRKDDLGTTPAVVPNLNLPPVAPAPTPSKTDSLPEIRKPGALELPGLPPTNSPFGDDPAKTVQKSAPPTFVPDAPFPALETPKDNAPIAIKKPLPADVPTPTVKLPSNTSVVPQAKDAGSLKKSTDPTPRISIGSEPSTPASTVKEGGVKEPEGKPGLVSIEPRDASPLCDPILGVCVSPGTPNPCRWIVFGEYLYWNVHGVDVPYAQAFDGVIPVLSVPRGPVAVASPKFNSGFRVGGGLSMEEGSGFFGTFTYFRTNRSDDTFAPSPFVLHNFLAFPNTANAAVDSLTAHVDYHIQLMMGDLDYKCAIINENERFQLSWLAGVRYANVQQHLESTFQVTGTTTVNSNINFDGFGPRAGFEGQYRVCGGVYGYAQGIVDLLFGQYHGNTEQNNVFTGLVGQTSINANRAVPILEMEVGLGWQSPQGHVHVSAGYYVGSWFNTVTMTSLSQAIAGTNFTTNGNNFRDTMTFDGFVLRCEFRY